MNKYILIGLIWLIISLFLLFILPLFKSKQKDKIPNNIKAPTNTKKNINVNRTIIEYFNDESLFYGAAEDLSLRNFNNINSQNNNASIQSTIIETKQDIEEKQIIEEKQTVPLNTQISNNNLSTLNF